MNTRLRELIAESLALSVDEVPADASSDTVEAWDSLAHIDIVQAVEEASGVRFTIEEIPELTSVDQLAAAVDRYGGTL